MSGTNIKVLTVNMHKGFSTFNRRFILHELRDAIRRTDADVVFLQEVLGEHILWSQKHPEHWPEKSQYEFLADEIWHSFAYGRNAVYPEGHHGNALLSRYPIKHWRNKDISLSGIEKRGLLHCELDLGGRTLHTICVHLSLREPHRQIQLRELAQLVNTIPLHEPVVVAGDFNDWRQKAHKVLSEKANLSEVYRETYGKPARTFPASIPFLRLDRIYVRSGQGHDPAVMPNKPWSRLSDHKPLYAEIFI